MSIETDIDLLKIQVKALRIQVQQQNELLETIASPFWKRFWWFIQGYRLYKVGRWYKKTTDLS